MSTYRFSAAERFAIFLSHDMKCYMCGAPLDLSSMEVDHVLPERLLADPLALNTTKSALGLPASFDVNSFENWLPACSTCNRKKASQPFNPSPLVQILLQRLTVKADKVRQLRDEMVSSRQVSIALGTLERALESGLKMEASARERLATLLGFASERELVRKGEPLRVTKSFQLVATTIKDATRWGATHWSLPPREPGEPTLVVLFRVEHGECSICSSIRRIYQPINQEGGGDPACDACLSELDWMPAVALGDLPTHIRDL